MAQPYSRSSWSACFGRGERLEHHSSTSIPAVLQPWQILASFRARPVTTAPAIPAARRSSQPALYAVLTVDNEFFGSRVTISPSRRQRHRGRGFDRAFDTSSAIYDRRRRRQLLHSSSPRKCSPKDLRRPHPLQRPRRARLAHGAADQLGTISVAVTTPAAIPGFGLASR